MSDVLNRVYETVDEQNRDKPAATRRQLVKGAAAALGSMGLLGVADKAWAQTDMASGNPSLPQSGRNDPPNTPENIVNIAATAEVLATIFVTTGYQTVGFSSQLVKDNVLAAAREELIHYQVLTSSAVGATPATKKIWIPDKYFASEQGFFTGILAADTIFVNAYLLGCTVFARAGGLAGSRFARYAAEFMGVEAAHRAIALTALGRVGSDRAFQRFGQREENPADPFYGQPGFYKITDAVTRLEAAGIGFGKEGSMPGRFYDFDTVSKTTPATSDPAILNTVIPS